MSESDEAGCVWECMLCESRPVRNQKRNKHHRKPRCAGGKGNHQNISDVRMLDHAAYHHLFGPGLPEEIAAIINEIWIDPEYELVVRKRRRKPVRKTAKKKAKKKPPQ